MFSFLGEIVVRCCSRRAQIGAVCAGGINVGTVNVAMGRRGPSLSSGGDAADLSSGEEAADTMVWYSGAERPHGWRKLAAAVKRLLAGNRAFSRLGWYLKEIKGDQSERARELRRRWSMMGKRLQAWKAYRLRRRESLQRQEIALQKIAQKKVVAKRHPELPKIWEMQETEWQLIEDDEGDLVENDE